MLLAWTYREQLPKAISNRQMPDISSGWAAISKWQNECALAIAAPNNFGVVADRMAERLDCKPHPDAIKIHEAVTALDAAAAQLPVDWNPFAQAGIECGPVHYDALDRAIDRLTIIDGPGKMAVWLPAGRGGRAILTGTRGQRILRTKLSEIVRRAAIMGDPVRPKLKCRVDVERGTDGQPRWFVMESYSISFDDLPYEREVEVRDGSCPGAFQKSVLSPDPVKDLVAIAHYELWLSAQKRLVSDLKGRLGAHEPLGNFSETSRSMRSPRR